MMQGSPSKATEKPRSAGAEKAASEPNEEPIVKMGYEKWNRFTVRFAPRDNPAQEFVLVLLREGLSWRLNAVRLPQL